MPNTRTSDEISASALDGTELVRIVQGGGNARATTAAISAITAAVLALSTGAATIGNIQFGAGAVQRTVSDKLADMVSVFDFMTPAQIADVKAGTLLNDHASAFDLAIATGRPVYAPAGPGWVYSFGHQVIVPSNMTVYSEWARVRLANGVNQHLFRYADGATNSKVRGFSIDGNKANNPTGGNGVSMGGTGGTYLETADNYIFNCNGNGIYLGGTSPVVGCEAVGNYSTGNGLAGVTMDATCTKSKLDGNFSWSNGTHGVGIIGIANTCSISYNIAWNNGLGTPSADNITGYNASNYNLTVHGNTTFGGLNNGMHIGGSKLRITGNGAYQATQYGIYVTPSTGSGDDITITENQTYLCGLAGIGLRNCTSGIISNNISNYHTGPGVLLDNSTDIAIGGNSLRGNGGGGIVGVNTNAWIAIGTNTIRSNTGNGIDLTGFSLSTIGVNIIRGNTGWGIATGAGEGNNIVDGSQVSGNGSGQIQQLASTSKCGGYCMTGVSTTIASAASITLPLGNDTFNISGTTDITTITQSCYGRRITLIANSGVTFKDGIGNLDLGSDFVAGATSVLELLDAGTGRYSQVSRSLN